MNIAQIFPMVNLARLTWHDDNRVFVVEKLLPALHCRKQVERVIRWAYGYDGSPKSYEMESDGSSVVPDAFMLGLIKEPPGVGHDMLNRMPGHVDPMGHRWTAHEANVWYFRACRDFGYSRCRAVARFVGLELSAWWWWK